MKKKILTAFMALCLILAGLFSAIPAYAANKNVTLEWTKLGSSYNCTHISYNYPTTYPNADIRVYKVDGRIAFCIQSAKSIRDKNGKSMMDYDSNDEMTQSVGVKTASTDNSLQSKVAYLGYYNNSHTNKNYAFTQMMIWQTLPNEDLTANGKNPDGSGFLTYFNNSDTRSEYNTWKKNIQAKIDEWDTRPSFNASTQTIKAGTSATLTDSKSVFDDYNAFTYTKDGITISHSKGSNTLTVTAASNCTKKSVSMSGDEIASAGGTKYSSTYDTAYTYTEDDTQNMATYGVVPSVPFSLSFDVATIGNLKLLKTSEAGFVAGISFRIEKDDGSYETTAVTGEDGTFTLEGLPTGTYTVTEITPEGFLPQEPQTVTVKAGETAGVRFDNTLIKGSISLIKYGHSPVPEDAGEDDTDDPDESTANRGELLAGAVYEIIALDDFRAADGSLLQQAGETVDTLTTDDNGLAKSKELYLGRYAIREVCAPPGFWLADEDIIVEITAEQRELKVEATDEMKTGAFRAMLAMEPLAFEHSINTVIPDAPKPAPVPEVPETPETPEVPKTGDRNDFNGFLILLILAAAATAAAALKAVKGNKKGAARK